MNIKENLIIFFTKNKRAFLSVINQIVTWFKQAWAWGKRMFSNIFTKKDTPEQEQMIEDTTILYKTTYNPEAIYDPKAIDWIKGIVSKIKTNTATIAIDDNQPISQDIHQTSLDLSRYPGTFSIISPYSLEALPCSIAVKDFRQDQNFNYDNAWNTFKKFLLDSIADIKIDTNIMNNLFNIFGQHMHQGGILSMGMSALFISLQPKPQPTDDGSGEWLAVQAQNTDFVIAMVEKLPPIANAKFNTIYIHKENDNLANILVFDFRLKTWQQIACKDAQLIQTHLPNIERFVPNVTDIKQHIIGKNINELLENPQGFKIDLSRLQDGQVSITERFYLEEKHTADSRDIKYNNDFFELTSDIDLNSTSPKFTPMHLIHFYAPTCDKNWLKKIANCFSPQLSPLNQTPLILQQGIHTAASTPNISTPSPTLSGPTRFKSSTGGST